MNHLYSKAKSAMIYDLFFDGFKVVDQNIWMKLCRNGFVKMSPVTLAEEEMNMYAFM